MQKDEDIEEAKKTFAAFLENFPKSAETEIVLEVLFELLLKGKINEQNISLPSPR